MATGQYTSADLAPAQTGQYSAADVAPAQAQSPGYLDTLWSDVKAMPGAMAGMVRHPADAVTGISDALKNERDKAVDLFKQGKYSEAFGHAMAGFIPVLGPMAAQAGEEIGDKEYGKGLAHATEALAPYALEAAPAAVRAAAPPLRAAVDATRDAAAAAVHSDIAPPIARNLGRVAGGYAGSQVAGVGGAIVGAEVGKSTGQAALDALKKRLPNRSAWEPTGSYTHTPADPNAPPAPAPYVDDPTPSQAEPPSPPRPQFAYPNDPAPSQPEPPSPAQPPPPPAPPAENVELLNQIAAGMGYKGENPFSRLGTADQTTIRYIARDYEAAQARKAAPPQPPPPAPEQAQSEPPAPLAVAESPKNESPQSPHASDLFHGTSSMHLDSILENGIAASRGHAYVSPFPEIARDVARERTYGLNQNGGADDGGEAHGGEPALVVLDRSKLREGGVKFKRDPEMNWNGDDWRDVGALTTRWNSSEIGPDAIKRVYSGDAQIKQAIADYEALKAPLAYKSGPGPSA